MHMLNGCKVYSFQKLLIQQLSYTDQQISKVEANIQKYIILFERDKISFYIVKEKLALYKKRTCNPQRNKENSHI
ncbi:hypothetical protein DZB91_23535 [Brevibacillus sp. VP]|nr:hypothetical protein DZB91_23535 [Brevibacillus sp. VP]